MTNNYLLKDLDEFKIRYVKNRIKDKLYALNNDDFIIFAYKDDKNHYNHKFIITDNDYFVSNMETVLMCKKLKNKNIYEVFTIPSTLNKDVISKAKKNLDKYAYRFNELLSFLALNEDCISYKDDDYLSWFYNIDLKELEAIKKIYFYDKSIIPYEDVSIKEAKLEYEMVPYHVINDFEIDGINSKNSLDRTINEINKRQNKSKIKAKNIYTK